MVYREERFLGWRDDGGAKAISGEATAISVERLARRSSTNCALCLSLLRQPLGVRAAHQQSELLARRFGRF
jgi:hypothetical protein